VGTKCVRDTVLGRDLVQTCSAVFDDFTDHQSGKMMKREAMNCTLVPLLDSVDRLFNFTKVGVSRRNVEVDGQEMLTGAFEFKISMEF
jgi:hypothetical protein